MITLDPNGFIAFDRKVQLKPYRPRTFIPYEEMTDNEIIDGIGGTLIVDTECYPNYHLIAFKNIKTKKIIKFEPNNFNAMKLSYVMHQYRTIGFNTIKYDLPMIWLAYACGQNTQLLKQLSNALILEGMWHKEAQSHFDFKIWPTPHVDLIEVCPLRGSLKLYAARLHAERIQDLPISDMAILDNDQIKIVSDYCINGDLAATELLYNNLTEQLQLRENMSREYGQDLLSKSDAQIAEAVISSEIKKATGSWPKKPDGILDNHFRYEVPTFLSFQTDKMNKILNIITNAKYSVDDVGRLIIPSEINGLQIPIGNGIYRLGIGGLHSSEKEICYKANDEYELSDRDVASYYPKIVLNLRLYPKHIGEIFLTIYKHLVDSRLEDKKAKRLAQAENKKVTVNGTFGKTGSPYSVLYAPQMTIQIVITGQLALLMLIEHLDLKDFEVISANTDGIIVYCQRTRREELNQIMKEWERLTGFETEETKYSAVYSRDVNAYLAVKEDGTVKGKNVYYDPWRSTSAKDLYWRFQKNPTAQICVEAVEKLIVNQIPIEKTIIDSKDITRFVSVKNVKGGAHKDGNYLGKVVRWYISREVQGTINYITSNNKVPDTDNARPIMDLPEQFPSDIAYEWYIARATEMLRDMAYYSRQKQMSFF